MSDRWAQDWTRDARAMAACAALAEAFDTDCSDGTCGDCAECESVAFDAEMDRRFEAMRDARFEN